MPHTLTDEEIEDLWTTVQKAEEASITAVRAARDLRGLLVSMQDPRWMRPAASHVSKLRDEKAQAMLLASDLARSAWVNVETGLRLTLNGGD